MVRERNNKSARHNGTLILLLTLVAVWLVPSFGVAGPVTDRIRGTFDVVIEVLNNPAYQGPENKDKREEKIRALVREVFDEEAIAKRALGKHWKDRSDAERKEFTTLFTNLLERTYFKKIDTYLDKGGDFSKDDIVYLNEKVKEPYAIVETKVITDEGSEIPVHYRMKSSDGNWLICDIAVEGVSIVRNYRAQFDEIIANSSYEDLIVRLKDKEGKKG